MTTVVKTRKSNRACRQALRSLVKQITDLRVVHIGPNQLQNIAVRVTPYSFEPNKQSHFFRPYALDTLKPLDKEEIDFPEPTPIDEEFEMETYLDNARFLSKCLEHTVYYQETTNPELPYMVGDGVGWKGQCTGSCRYIKHALCAAPPSDPNPYGRYQWLVMGLAEHQDPRYPHIKSSMIYGEDTDKVHNTTLLVGEIVSIIEIIRGRLRLKAFANHYIVPVLLFSFINDKFRIIEAHYDGTQLVVHCSNFYDLANVHDTPWDFFAQWYLSAPIGNTITK